MANLIAYLNRTRASSNSEWPANPRSSPYMSSSTSHWITMAGVALVTLAGFSWLFALPANIRGDVSNPYIGLLRSSRFPSCSSSG